MNESVMAARVPRAGGHPRDAAGDGGGPRGATDFCRTCALYHACAMVGFGEPELSPLHGLMEHLGPYRAGEILWSRGDPFQAVFAVRAGTVKTRQRDAHGREHVLGFHLPGEVIGLTAIDRGVFPCDAVALDDAFLCRFSFPAITALARRRTEVQRHLFRLLSRELGTATVQAGDHGADARVAAFLVDLGERYARRGFSASEFHLGMPRGDIASFLRLATETVSRVFARFRTRGLITLDRRAVTLLDREGLRRIARQKDTSIDG